MTIFNLKKECLSLGQRGEKAAVNYLKKSGYKILVTNFYNPSGRRMGEIDIIAQDKQEIVFVEVKTRTITTFKNNPLPEESVSRSKIYKINKTASFFLFKNRLLDKPYRFDVLAISADPENNQATVRHLKNIFL